MVLVFASLPVQAEELAQWTFSETSGDLAMDSSGHGQHGVLMSGSLMGGPVRADGYFGSGLDFAAEGAHVSVAGHPSINQLNQVTLAAWVRQPHVGEYSSIIDKRDASTDGYNLYVNHQGRAFFRVNDKVLTGTSTVSDGTWHHLAGVWNGSTMELYVDGQLERSRAASLATVGVLDVSAPLLMGAHFDGVSRFEQPGVLDEVRVFGHALGNTELMALLTPPIQGGEPLAQWTFEEGAGTSTADVSGHGHGAEFMEGTLFTTGFEGGGLSLEGLDDGAQVAAADPLGQLSTLTVAAWVRSAPTNGFAALVDFRQAGDDGYDLYFDPAGRGFFRVNEETLVGATEITDESWHHLAAVWDGVSLTLYLDGQVDARRIVGPSTLQVEGTFWIGRHFREDPRYEGTGRLDDLRVYARPLAESEVVSLAQRDVDERPDDEATGLLAFWSFEEGAGLVATDGSGHGHDGVLSGGAGWTDGYLGSALSFPAGADEVRVDHGGALGTLHALTVSAWVKSPQTESFASIIDCRHELDEGYDFYLDDQGLPFARINGTTLTGTTPVGDQTWHHLALVWDGSRLAIYVDGSEDAHQFIAEPPIETAAPLLLGSHFALGGTFGFEGTLDEVKIYDRALGHDEILELSSSYLSLASGFTDKHVIQRRGAAADVPLAGAWRSSSSGVPSGIEARMVEFDTGLPLPGLDWQVIDPAPAAGHWAGTLPDVPEGGWYRIEVRFADNPSTTLMAPHRIGVGMVFAALGQSSMAKLFTEISFSDDGDLGTVSNELPDPLTHRLGYGDPRISQTKRGGYLRTVSSLPPPSPGEVTGAGGTRLVNNLVNELQIPVRVLDYAIDGTSILDWTDPSWIGRRNFEDGLRTAGGEAELILWFQGGTDILNGMAGPVYEDHLETLYLQLRDLLPVTRDLEFFVAVQARGDYGGTHDTAYTDIRGVQLRWPERSWPENQPPFHEHIHHGGTAIDLHLAAKTYERGDGHVTASQTQTLADRFSRAIFHWLGRWGFEGGVRGGEISAARQYGNEVHVDIAHDAGTAIQVRDPDADVEGFELSDDGFQTVWRLEAGILSATITPDGQQVVLTLVQPVTGPLQLRYLYGMNPFGHRTSEEERRANGNTLFDDFVYHTEREGLPINPTVEPVPVAPGF